MGSSPGANHYWRGRLPSAEGDLEETGARIPKGVLGEVRGDRAGRTPGRSSRMAQNLTATPSRATELWIGTLNRLPF